MSEEKPQKEAIVEKFFGHYASLVEHLKNLNKALDQGHPELEVCLEAVAAVTQFLNEDKAVLGQGLTRPLEILKTNLRDLSLGANPRLFQKPKKNKANRPSGTSEVVTVQALAAAGLELLHRAGMGFEESASFIARELQKAGITHTGPRRPITNKTIFGWRAEMGGRNDPVSNAIYKQIVGSGLGLGRDASLSAVKQRVIESIRGLRDEGIGGRRQKSD